MKTRIYKVNTPLGSQLIRAATPASAIRHATRELFSADVATHDDLEKAVINGEKILRAGEDTTVDDKTVDDFPDPAVEALDGLKERAGLSEPLKYQGGEHALQA